jgi:hypothetical protein
MPAPQGLAAARPWHGSAALVKRFPQLGENQGTGTSLEDFMTPLPLRAAFRNLFLISHWCVNIELQMRAWAVRSIALPGKSAPVFSRFQIACDQHPPPTAVICTRATCACRLDRWIETGA